MRHLRRLKFFMREAVAIFAFIFSPGVIAGVAVCESIYWSSPRWAQTIGFPTREGDKTTAITACTELLATACKTTIVHDGGTPIPPEGLPEWTPIRVEQRFTSGLAVVSTLGPHANFQYIVRDLELPVNAAFRIVDGVLINI